MKDKRKVKRLVGLPWEQGEATGKYKVRRTVVIFATLKMDGLGCITCL